MPGEGSGFPPFPDKKCFPLDALVSTPDGAREISDIKRGEIVHAFNSAGEIVEATVMMNLSFDHAFVETVTLENPETGETLQWQMTPSHRIAAGADQGKIAWQALSDFEDGDAVLLHDPEKNCLSDVWVLHRGDTQETQVCNLITTENSFAVLPGNHGFADVSVPMLPALCLDDQAFGGLHSTPIVKAVGRVYTSMPRLSM